jgi:hypothetical protein
MAADWAVAMGGRTDFRLAEPVPAPARSLRKAGGHPRGIAIPRMHSDLLAFPASRLGGGLKVDLAPAFGASVMAPVTRRASVASWARGGSFLNTVLLPRVSFLRHYPRGAFTFC